MSQTHNASSKDGADIQAACDEFAAVLIDGLLEIEELDEGGDK